jgi:hypothetical protein
MKSYCVNGRPAMAAPLARLRERYWAGEPVTVEPAFAAAGLTAREAHVLLARTFGRSYGDIASDDALLKADGSPLSLQLLAHVIVSKLCDHLPLHRQESILARHGWDVRRSTLCDHLQRCSVLLTPLYDVMHRRLLTPLFRFRLIVACSSASATSWSGSAGSGRHPYGQPSGPVMRRPLAWCTIASNRCLPPRSTKPGAVQ